MSEVLDRERQFTAEGYEGVIVNPDIPYYRGRSSNKMMKFKTMHSFDCKVVSVYAGDKGSKYQNTLGGLIVTQENGQQCGVGSGFTDAERDYIWNNPKDAIGRVAEIKFQELSQDKIMRFPIFMRWRNEKV
jgi:DNA ligase-1